MSLLTAAMQKNPEKGGFATDFLQHGIGEGLLSQIKDKGTV